MNLVIAACHSRFEIGENDLAANAARRREVAGRTSQISRCGKNGQSRRDRQGARGALDGHRAAFADTKASPRRSASAIGAFGVASALIRGARFSRAQPGFPPGDVRDEFKDASARSCADS
jgi:hypothetical protein